MLNRIKTLVSRLGNALDLSRRIALNLTFLSLIAAGLWLAFDQGEKELKEKTVLVLSLQGRLVESASSEEGEQWLMQWLDDEQKEVVLPELVQSLKAAADDPKITQALLLLDGFEGGGLASMDELAKALAKFRSSGKPVIAWGTRYDQRQYRIASQANEVLMHPMGEVMIEGFGRRRNYYRDALDRLGITPHLIRVGEYKSAGEPWIANKPSQEALQADAFVLKDLWKRFTNDIEQARKLDAGHIENMMNSLPGSLEKEGGDAAALAVKWKLVDGLIPYPKLRERLMCEGVKEEAYQSFRQINAIAYAQRHEPEDDDDYIGILVAEGEIRERGQGAQVVGGRETAEKIRKAAEDEKLKALILRVDSPGGSAVGSEFIRQALESFQDSGKPVVVSMGDLAASGGYWISLSADRIISHPSSITGSIGVYGLLPTAQGLMDKLSIRTGGYQSHWLAGGYDPRVDLDPKMKALVESRIQKIYKDFIELTAKARNQSSSEVDQVARGRVWTGAQAQTHRLVDELGGIDEAVAAARKLLVEAKQAPDADKGGAKPKDPLRGVESLQVRYVSSEDQGFASVLKRFFRSALQSLGLMESKAPAESIVPTDRLKGLLADAYREGLWAAQWLGEHERWSAQAHCFCAIEP